METTTHTIKQSNNQAASIPINHQDYCAIAYDFYIPSLIWEDQAVQAFRTRLQSIDNSATIFNGLTGVWRGEQECTQIYRVILRSGRFDRQNVKIAFQNEVGRLMADLTLVPGHNQQAVLFTETELHVSLSSQQLI